MAHDTAKKGRYFHAIGKRKTAIASVRLYESDKGMFTINTRQLKEYFPVRTLVGTVMSPLKMTDTGHKFDISVQVKGGGISAQADAIRHGISKALLEHSELLRTTLKKAGFLTRDARIKERKKYGLKKARRAGQFSKR